jgi:hypothetical protein
MFRSKKYLELPFVHALLFDQVDGDTLLLIIDKFLPDYAASHLRR